MNSMWFSHSRKAGLQDWYKINTPDVVIFKGTIINVSLLELDLSTPMDIAVLVFTPSGSPTGDPARTLSRVSLLLYLTAAPVWPSFLAVECC